MDDARTLGLCSVKGSEAWGLELNLLATVPQFPSLVSGLCPATSEPSVPPSHRAATLSPFLTISCHNCSPRPCPSPPFASTKDAAPGQYAHHLPTVTQEEPDVPASPRCHCLQLQGSGPLYPAPPTLAEGNLLTILLPTSLHEPPSLPAQKHPVPGATPIKLLLKATGQPAG